MAAPQRPGLGCLLQPLPCLGSCSAGLRPRGGWAGKDAGHVACLTGAARTAWGLGPRLKLTDDIPPQGVAGPAPAGRRAPGAQT